MGEVSLLEDIEEAQRLAGLAGKGLAALAKSEASTAEVARQERIIEGLLKRCQYIVATLDDVRVGASEIGRDIGNHAYLLRTRLEQATDRVAELERQIGDLGVRLRVKLARKKKKKKKKVARTARPTTKPEPKRREPAKRLAIKPSIEEKLRSKSYEAAPAGTVNQAFTHGRKKQVIVEKLVRRGRSKPSR